MKNFFKNLGNLYKLENIFPTLFNCFILLILLSVIMSYFYGDFYVYQCLKNDSNYCKIVSGVPYEDGMTPIQAFAYNSDLLYIQTSRSDGITNSDFTHLKTLYENKSNEENRFVVDVLIDYSGNEDYQNVEPYKIYNDAFLDEMCKYDGSNVSSLKNIRAFPYFFKYYLQDDVISLVVGSVLGVLIIDVLFKLIVWVFVYLITDTVSSIKDLRELRKSLKDN